jgi:hypothetical protein
LSRLVEADAIESEPLRQVIRWYRGLTPASGWPPVQAFRPEDLPPMALPHIGRVDVELAPFRVFYRALGSAICQSIGQEVSRQYLDELDFPQKADLEQWFRTAVAAPGPLFVRFPQTVDGDSFIYEGMGLPFGAPGDDPRAFLIAEDFLHIGTWRASVRHRRYDPLE